MKARRSILGKKAQETTNEEGSRSDAHENEDSWQQRELKNVVQERTTVEEGRIVPAVCWSEILTRAVLGRAGEPSETRRP